MEEAKTVQIDPEERIPFMKVDETDFASMTRGEQIRHFEVEGYVILPRVLSPELVRRLKAELADAEMTHKSYSVHQTYAPEEPQWISRGVAEIIAHEPTIAVLRDLLGQDIIFTRGFFQRTHPGSPGISMHTDGQPHGSDLFGNEGTCPRLVRVLYYLDDLKPERAPFRVIPRSHLSFHAEASPYVRYKWHPEEVTLCVPAGSAVVVPAMMFHGSHPNTDQHPRELVQFGYRPAWAGPIQPVEDWDPERVANAPQVAKPFLQSLNTNGVVFNQPHKPKGMPTDAPGINPSRWDAD